jgi:hypothetical protein
MATERFSGKTTTSILARIQHPNIGCRIEEARSIAKTSGDKLLAPEFYI